MKKCFKLFVLFFGLISIQESFSQKFWQKVNQQNYKKTAVELLPIKNTPSKFDIVKINEEQFVEKYSNKSRSRGQIISLPTINGKEAKFILNETSNFSAELEQKYPTIKSFTAQGIDDPTAIAKISIGNDGFHATIFSGKHATIYIDPYSKDKKEHILYSKKDLDISKRDFKCDVNGFEDSIKKSVENQYGAKGANDGQLRTYRLAIVATGGYSQFHLNRQNVSASATDAEKKAAVLSAINTTITRVNGVFERDLGVHLEIVANNEDVIFLDAATDGVTDGDASVMIEEVQEICDNRIGANNYDVGHVFGTGGSGLASLGVVCSAGNKAKGVTGIGQPIGDPYDIDFVIHEFGHQFGATHTQNNSCQRQFSTAVEPGSGSTIMGYAGICSPNVIGVGSATGNSDDHFHAVNIAQMWSYIQSSAGCATLTSTTNVAPTANAGLDYNIPRSTPFKLTGNATDANGLETLTYNWEQIDNEIGNMPPTSANLQGPMFRSLPSSSSPTRFFPNLETVLSGSSSNQWEVVPGIGRDLNFAFTVRDNHPVSGNVARDDMKVTVVNVVAFTVTAPSSSVTWDVGSSQTISWVKGRTNLDPINCNFVNIKLSTDGGRTFPIMLKENTPNDGSETIIIPNNATENARIMVEAVDNIFFNVNPSVFTINSTQPTFILANQSGQQNVCNTNSSSAQYTLNFDFVNGFNEAVNLSTSGLPSGVTVNFSVSSVTGSANVVLTLSNLQGVQEDDYTFKVIGASQSLTQEIEVVLGVKSSQFNEVVLNTPSNGIDGLGLVQELSWQVNANALSYLVEIATDTNFSNIIQTAETTTNTFTTNTLSMQTTYYWRVKPKNGCGEGSFSTAFSFTTTTPSYCDSNYTDEAGGQEHITNVTFGSINNTSGNDTNDGYEDFTNFSTTLKRGDTEQISVTFDTAGFQDQCFVYIDWNQDFVFDAQTEKYDLGRFSDDVATAIQNITVPDAAALGTTRMRVIIEYYRDEDGFVPGDGACDIDQDSEWGETEDYTLIIEEATASLEDTVFNNFAIYPNPSSGLFTLKFETQSSNDVQLDLIDIRGRRIQSKVYKAESSLFNQQVSFEKASKGMYLLRIKNGSYITTKKIVIQ